MYLDLRLDFPFRIHLEEMKTYPRLKTLSFWYHSYGFHLKTVGAQGVLRYSEFNTFLQCNRYCNKGLSGNINGNKTTRGYLQGLKDRFGDKAGESIINRCESHTEAAKWTCEELEEMRKGFYEEVRKLESEME